MLGRRVWWTLTAPIFVLLYTVQEDVGWSVAANRWHPGAGIVHVPGAREQFSTDQHIHTYHQYTVQLIRDEFTLPVVVPLTLTEKIQKTTRLSHDNVVTNRVQAKSAAEDRGVARFCSSTRLVVPIVL